MHLWHYIWMAGLQIKRRRLMNNTYIRKVDILDLITFNLRHLKGIIAVIIIGILISGGYRLNEFRITLNNAEYVNSVQAAEKVRASCVIYVDGKDYTNSASERVVDMSSIVKSYDVVNNALAAAGVTADYKNVFNWIYTTVVANNMVEVCIDLSLVPDITQEQTCKVLENIIEQTQAVTAQFNDNESYVTLVEKVHEGSYYLDRKTGTDIDGIEVDKVSEMIGVAKYCVLGGAAGFVVAVFCLCVFYLLSTVLRTEEDMCHGFSNVVIGKMFGRDKESMRKAKTVIAHDGNHKAVNLISITDKEDRAVAADALAAALSVNGSRAVLVDACKESHTGKKGIYEYVAGKCSVDDIITDAEGYKKIVRNDIQEDIDIFAHARFAELIAQLKEKFDYVVVNSPAYKKSADGMLISQVCDKTVVIAGRNVVKDEDAQDLRKNLVSNEINYEGIILTK